MLWILTLYERSVEIKLPLQQTNTFCEHLPFSPVQRDNTSNQQRRRQCRIHLDKKPNTLWSPPIECKWFIIHAVSSVRRTSLKLREPLCYSTKAYEKQQQIECTTNLNWASFAVKIHSSLHSIPKRIHSTDIRDLSSAWASGSGKPQHQVIEC